MTCSSPTRLAVFLVTAFAVACGDDGDDNDLTPAGDDTTPSDDDTTPLDTTAPSATRDTALALANSATVVIHFSESMLPSSLQLGGTLASSATATWSATNSQDDTLTLTPAASGWPRGSNQDLTIAATDLAGNALSSLRAEYVVPLVFDAFQSADLVIGQATFADRQANRGGSAAANTLNYPYTGPAIANNGTLFVSDYSNNRVLAFASIPAGNGASADFVLGQPDATTTTPGVTQTKATGSEQVFATEDGKLAIAEWDNSRILIYNVTPVDMSALADVVVGQSTFDTGGAACSQTGLANPETFTITPNGKLIVTDSYNHRVLIWNTLPASNGAPADVVLGQATFDTCISNDENQDGVDQIEEPSARTLNYPAGVWSDGTRLVVADVSNIRVLIWNQVPTSNFQPADIVLGQGDFTHHIANDDNQDGTTDTVSSARTFAYAYDGVSSNGVQLAITDGNNHRVLIWNSFPTTNFQPADMVLGQSDFTHTVANDDDQNGNVDAAATARTLSFPTGATFYRDRLFVTDTNNHRVVVFTSK